MSRVIALLYSVISYLFFLGTFLYAIGFVGNILVPRSVDGGLTAPLGTALLINALLLSLFAIQHTIMARPGFKEVLTRIIPKAAERSTFVMATCVVMSLMFWQWRSMPGIVWSVDSVIGSTILHGISWFGWLVVLLSTFMINHFDLFGLRQAWLGFRKEEITQLRFQTTGFYAFVRHPIMTGFIIAFWATPDMTLGHLFFAVMTTGYIMVGLLFEERDLVAAIGEDYKEYRRHVNKLIPFLPRKGYAGGTGQRRLD